MRIAIPLQDGRCCVGFAPCEQMALLDVNVWTREVTARVDVTLPETRQESLPEALLSLGVRVVMAGSMSPQDKKNFRKRGMVVIIGVPLVKPEDVVRSYMLCGLSPTVST